MTDQVTKALYGLDLIPRHSALHRSRHLSGCSLQYHLQCFQSKWLREVVIGALLHGLHRGMHGGVRGHDDNLGLGPAPLNFMEHFQTAGPGIFMSRRTTKAWPLKPDVNLIFAVYCSGRWMLRPNLKLLCAPAPRYNNSQQERRRDIHLTQAMDIYSEIVRLRQKSRRGALATIINVRGSIPSFETAKMLVRDDGSIAGTIGGGCVEAEVWQAAKEVMQTEKPRTLTFNLNQNPKYDTGLVCGGTLEIFIEPILPVPQLYLFGAGHVAFNLYKVARLAGFDVTVIDDRESYANRERFPEAKDIYAEDYDRVLPQLAPNESSFITIVTRGHHDDMRILRWALKSDVPCRYIGMIGSERKFTTVAKELEAEGVPRARLEGVYSPLGIDIGAITPEEIAVAVVAEMIAVRRNSPTTLPHLSWTRKAANTDPDDSSPIPASSLADGRHQ